MLFFHFSGHGAQLPDRTGVERDGYNETIVPCDFHRGVRHITDDEVWAAIVRPLPSGVRLTAIMDCCHSGTGMDLPLKYNVASRQWSEDVNLPHSAGDVVLFSGCTDDQVAADVHGGHEKAQGAMTKSLLAAYKERCRSTSSSSIITYADLLDAIHVQLCRKGFPQKPQMTSSQRFDAQTRVFSISSGVIITNKNEQIGRKKTRHFRPGRPTNRAGDSRINDILVGAAIRATVLRAIQEALF